MSEQKTLEELKAMSREDRLAYFEANKKALLSTDDLDNVNGGTGGNVINPDSRGDDDGLGNYYTSWGYTCRGIVCC